MGTITHLEVKSSRHAAEDAVWHAERSVAALQQLANEGIYFMDLEVQEMRKAAYDLIGICDQVTANMKLGSR